MLYVAKVAFGMGCFTDALIKKGERIFEDGEDESEYCSITPKEYHNLPEQVKRFFLHFAFVEGDRVRMCYGPGAYCNHDPNPNIDDYGCFAARDIAPGEEITWDYRTLKCDEYGNYYCANFLHYDEATIRQRFL